MEARGCGLWPGERKKTQLEAASPREERLASAASEENFELQSAAVQGGKWALDGDNGRSIFGDGVFASHFDWTTYYYR